MLTIHVHRDATMWRTETVHGSNVVSEPALSILINRPVQVTDKHYVLKLRMSPGGHAVAYNVTESANKSRTLCAKNYPDKLFVASGALAKIVDRVSFKGKLYIEAVLLASDGKRTPAKPMRGRKPIPVPRCTIQPTLPGF